MKKTLLPTIIFAALWFMFTTDSFAATLSKPPNNLGLVGYWSFNEGTGTKAGDSSGNGNTGTIYGATWADGKRGKALSFDGNDYVAIDDPFENNTDFTISLWVKNDVINDGSYHGFIGKQGDACRKPGMWLAPGNNGGLHYDSYDSTCTTRYSGLLSNFFQGKNIWHHIVWTKSGNTYTFYRNGSFFTNASAPTNFYTISTRYWIGKVDNYWRGDIDDVRIYNRALSPSEISRLYQAGQVTRKMVSNRGLVGYWTLSEGRGTDADDYSGNGNIGTINNASWVNGKRGKALYFAGADTTSYVQVSSFDNFPTTEITTAFWVKTNDSGGDGIISYASTESDNNWLIFNSANIEIYRNNPVTSGVSINDNQWHHIVVTWRGNDGQIILYKDGEQVYSGTLASGTSITTGGCLMFAQEQDSVCGGTVTAQAHTGTLDDVRIYNRILSPTEVLNLYKQSETRVNTSQNSRLTNGLVGLWSFNGPDISGTTAYDRSGQGNNGTINGATPAIGKVGQALSFDGSNDYISINNSTALDNISSAFSFAAWVKFNQVTRETDGYDWQALFTKDSWGAWYGLMLCTDAVNCPNHPLRFYHSGLTPGNSNYSWSNVKPNTWYHVAVVYDGSKTYHFINGVQVADEDVTGTPATNSNDLILGCSGSACSTYPLDGLMDDVRIYNRALSEREIKQLYMMGN